MEPRTAPSELAATPTTFGEWLTQQCIAYQVRVGTRIQTDSAFAQLVGVAPSTFIMWRTNRAKPQRAHCRRLAEVFAVSPVEVQLALLLPLVALPKPSVAEVPPMEAQDA